MAPRNLKAVEEIKPTEAPDEPTVREEPNETIPSFLQRSPEMPKPKPTPTLDSSSADGASILRQAAGRADQLSLGASPTPNSAGPFANLGADPIPSPDDPFANLASLRLDQNFVETAGVKKLLTTVPVRKPHAQEWVRVHPAAEYRGIFAVIELKEDRDVYLVTPDMAHELPGEFTMATIFTVVSRQNTILLWHAKLPGPDGRILEWHRSAMEAAEMAMRKWIRIKANMSLGAYEIFPAPGPIGDPEWAKLLSGLLFGDLLRIGFRDKLINTLDHPVVKLLHGR